MQLFLRFSTILWFTLYSVDIKYNFLCICFSNFSINELIRDFKNLSNDSNVQNNELENEKYFLSLVSKREKIFSPKKINFWFNT